MENKTTPAPVSVDEICKFCGYQYPNHEERCTNGVDKAAQDFASKTFEWPKNSKGEDMAQRVGQKPHGWRKHCDKVITIFKAGAEWQQLQSQQQEELPEWDGRVHMDEQLWQQESPQAKKEWIESWRREAAFIGGNFNQIKQYNLI